ncbi:conserved membrane hypothetical protein [Vibrio nigripulchritudo SO65]|uniref:TRAP transporter large permease n=1 Tax=Vibrio nigripulchritudo TaxID=28173 RepID=UPI0003B21E2C|nr:TRAP transporter large permease [Vibrio nigripulchritudo]CCN38613.1 conserved membrane hypothetical protein [Vibrio nigripulchritudo AM115]CCN44922.1 conserved membrane hypothetical protein [Vibrio nigripulchritudo FTn2]CCN79677.1 conserved membrane hypothetical protein [Vibrio nigripulchritudo SO65]
MSIGILGLLFVVMVLCGVPIAFTLLALSVVSVIYNPALIELILVQRIVIGTQSFPLLAVPLFILAGELMNISGISGRVMNFAQVLTKKLPGGLAQSNIVLSMLLAGMSGSANADAAMQGKILVPEMVERGYPKSFSTIVTAFSGLISPMIPPGISLIILAFVCNLSIGAMFVAAIIPGALLAIGLMTVTHFLVKRRGYEPPDNSPRKPGTLRKALLRSFPALILPIFIIVGIRFGVFTPTEAAACAVVYTGLFCFIYRETSWKQVKKALTNVVKSTAAILLIIAASSAFSWVLTFQQVPQQIAMTITQVSSNPTVMLMIIALLLLIIGMFIEGTASILILAPIFLPVVQQLGIDPIHYGIVFVYFVHLGGVTPPVGTIMFTACSVTGLSTMEFAKHCMNYLFTVIGIGLLLILFPPLVIGIL